jgi:hypothetical protein
MQLLLLLVEVAPDEQPHEKDGNDDNAAGHAELLADRVLNRRYREPHTVLIGSSRIQL